MILSNDSDRSALHSFSHTPEATHVSAQTSLIPAPRRAASVNRRTCNAGAHRNARRHSAIAL